MGSVGKTKLETTVSPQEVQPNRTAHEKITTSTVAEPKQLIQALPKQFCKMRSNKICFVTSEFHGLFKNGGIGTANTGLATTLAAEGFDVTVVYADCDEIGPRVRFDSFDVVQSHYRKLGITLEYVHSPTKLHNAFDDVRSVSYAIYLYLKDKDFDAIYFNECGGQPFYTVIAKRAGVLRVDPAIFVVTHGGHEWLHEINLISWHHRQLPIIAFMERKAIELADAVISPSQYLIDWMIKHEYKLPAHVFLEQNIVDVKPFAASAAENASISSFKELVFFGRQEVRKGLKLFCDAIDQISPALLGAGAKITFIGKFSTVEGFHSGAYILARSRRWNIPVQFRVNYGQAEGLSYLIKSRALAVIPSLAENSPCVVAECLQLGIPFIATDTGGTAELVHKKDRARCLVSADPREMAKRLIEIVRTGQKAGRMAISQTVTVRNWIDFHAPSSLTTLSTSPRKRLSAAELATKGAAANAETFTPGANRTPLPGPEPRVSICLVHYNNPAFVNQALESILNQSYSNYEVIIVDDGSTQPEAISNLQNIEASKNRIPVKVVRQANLYLGAARNTGARHARGDYFIFVDDDNLLMPTAIEDFVRAAMLLKADIVTAVPYHFYSSSKPRPEYDGEIRLLPLGGCAEVGMFENCFGDANALVSRRAYQTVGGFHEDYGKAVEDWEFFATATLKGLKLEVLPEPAFWYRVRSEGMFIRSNAVENARRIINLYCTYPISVICKMVEGLLEMEREESNRLSHMIDVSGGSFRDLLLQISRGDVNGVSSVRGLLDYMVRSGRVGEALDFALNNNLDLLEGVLKLAHQENRTGAIQEITNNNLEIHDEIVLTEEVRLRSRPVANINQVDFSILESGAFSHPVSINVSAVKAAGTGPSGTVSARATVLQLDGDETEVLAAIVLCEPQHNIALVNGDVVPNEYVSWSEWTPLEVGTPKHVGIALATATTDEKDIFFLTKVAEGAKFRDASVSWIDLTANVISVPRTTKSNLIFDLKAHKLPDRIVALTGQFLTPTDKLEIDFHPFLPGKTTTLHPIHDSIALLRLKAVVPAAAKGARATVSVANPKAHPVQFGMWLHNSAQPIDNYDDLRKAQTFSGWLTVSTADYSYSLNAVLSDVATHEMDLYIATRVVGQENVHFCHALLHEFYWLD